MSKQNEECGVKLIIDVDTGVDDAQALMMALCSTSGAEVVAITCVDGNTVVEQVCRNTVRVLGVCGALQVRHRPQRCTWLCGLRTGTRALTHPTVI